MKKFLNIAYKIFFWLSFAIFIAFILLFILAFAFRDKNVVKAEYYPPQKAGFLVQNSEIYRANLLNVTDQDLNSSDYGWSYPDSLSEPLNYMVLNGIVDCNGNFVTGYSNGMLLNYSGDLSDLAVNTFIKSNYTGVFRFHFVNKDFTYSKDYFFNLVSGVDTFINFIVDLSDYSYSDYGRLYLRGGYYGPPQDNYDGFSARLTNFMICQASQYQPFTPSYSDIQYFGIFDGYNTGYSNGYSIGLQDGYDLPEPTASNFFTRVLDILDVKIFGFVSLGDMFKVVFAVSLVLIILRLFAGG